MLDAAVLAGCACAIAAGQLLFKLAAGRLAGERIMTLVVNPYLLLGLALYGIATLAWVWELRSVPLSQAYPFMAVSFVLVPIASFFLLGESLSAGKLIGALLISIGIVVSVTR